MNLHPFRRALPALTAVLLAACENGAASQPPRPQPAPGAADALYMGLRVNFEGGQYPDYYTFLADGRAFRGTPDEGLARPLDWAAVCAVSECGTYTVHGSEIVFRREPSGDTQTFIVDGEGVLRKPGQVQGYRRMHVPDGTRLSATWGSVAEGDTLVALTLGADGRFRERGVLAWTAWDARGGPAPVSGAGTYTLTHGTLELRYDGGPTVRLLLAVPPGAAPAPTPESIYLRVTLLDRLP
jgi:hypothetical protein